MGSGAGYGKHLEHILATVKDFRHSPVTLIPAIAGKNRRASLKPSLDEHKPLKVGDIG